MKRPSARDIALRAKGGNLLRRPEKGAAVAVAAVRRCHLRHRRRHRHMNHRWMYVRFSVTIPRQGLSKQMQKSGRELARMGNHAKRVNVRCALWMIRAVFSAIPLGPKTSVHHVKVIVVSTASGCDVTYCVTTLPGFNKQNSKPLLLTGSPIDSGRENKERAREVLHMAFICELYETQLHGGRYFFHAHAHSADSWEQSTVVDFMNRFPGAFQTVSDRSLFGPNVPHGLNTLTRWLTNSGYVAQTLS